MINSYRLFPKEFVSKGYSLRHDGNMSFEFGDNRGSLENRKLFLAGLNMDYRNLVCARQSHGSRVFKVTLKDAGRGALSKQSSIPDTDAFITSEKNIPLAVFTADCLSIVLFDPKQNAIGLVHAGWRSSREKILTRVVEAMYDEFGTSPSDLQVEFGPAIKNCCYEIGDDVAVDFLEYISRRNDLLYLDLVSANIKQAQDTGVQEENIIDASICTFCNSDKLYSFRKDKADCGRMISVVMLK